MKPSDIIVGQLYLNLNNSGQVCLGVGQRVMWQGTYKNKDSKFTNKQLVIVKDNTEHDCVGQMIQSPENCLNGYWDRIVPLAKVGLVVV